MLDEKIANVNLQMQPLLGKHNQPVNPDLSHFEKKFAEIDEQLNDKASKSSVAQALHRKVNKTDISEEISKKIDVHDFNRLMTLLDQKVDLASFEKVVQTINNKADRFEI